jgi:hypothetical protein
MLHNNSKSVIVSKCEKEKICKLLDGPVCDGGGRDPVEGDCLVVQGQHVLALVNGQGAVRLAQFISMM